MLLKRDHTSLWLGRAVYLRPLTYMMLSDRLTSDARQALQASSCVYTKQVISLTSDKMQVCSNADVCLF